VESTFREPPGDGPLGRISARVSERRFPPDARFRAMRSRSILLAGLVAFALLAAGCLSATPETGTGTVTTGESETGTDTPTVTAAASTPGIGSCPADTATPTSTPTTPATPGSGTPTATESDFEFAPDRETPVLLRNAGEEAVEVRVRVVCETNGETIHEGSYVVAPDARPRPVVDLARANPDAGVTLRVVVTARNATGSVTATTTACADVTGEVRADGGVRVWATC
jgi:hypothetical protein